MKLFSSATVPSLVLVGAVALCFDAGVKSTPANAAGADTDFSSVIDLDFGASEFAPGDGIVITSLRGNRNHLEPGGRYILEGSYTLASAESADLAWFSTSRGPSGSTPITEEEHVKIERGSGRFHLEKTLSDDGWLHVSFYVNGQSHGGIYFGEKGVEKSVLRRKGWSDFSNVSSPLEVRLKPNLNERDGGLISNAANAAILAYLGNPVAAPADLDSKYTPTNLMTAFTQMSRKAGWSILKLSVDDSEFPFLVYGLLAGKHELSASDIRETKGYDYGGSVRGNADGATYFSLNMIPHDQYPSGQSAFCDRRLMIRLQMVADLARESKQNAPRF